MGGLYETLIGLVKQSLRNSIEKICLTMVKLETVIKEIEVVVNSRSLVYVGADFSSGFTLNPKTGIPSEEDRQQDPDFFSGLSSAQKLLDIWLKAQQHLDMFWKLLFAEDVLSLRELTLKHLRVTLCKDCVTM